MEPVLSWQIRLIFSLPFLTSSSLFIPIKSSHSPLALQQHQVPEVIIPLFSFSPTRPSSALCPSTFISSVMGPGLYYSPFLSLFSSFISLNFSRSNKDHFLLKVLQKHVSIWTSIIWYKHTDKHVLACGLRSTCKINGHHEVQFKSCSQVIEESVLDAFSKPFHK